VELGLLLHDECLNRMPECLSVSIPGSIGTTAAIAADRRCHRLPFSNLATAAPVTPP